METTCWSGVDDHHGARSSLSWGRECMHSCFEQHYISALTCKPAQYAWWECLHPRMGPNYHSVLVCELAQHADQVGLWGAVPLDISGWPTIHEWIIVISQSSLCLIMLLGPLQQQL